MVVVVVVVVVVVGAAVVVATIKERSDFKQNMITFGNTPLYM